MGGAEGCHFVLGANYITLPKGIKDKIGTYWWAVPLCPADQLEEFGEPRHRRLAMFLGMFAAGSSLGSRLLSVSSTPGSTCHEIASERHLVGRLDVGAALSRQGPNGATGGSTRMTGINVVVLSIQGTNGTCHIGSSTGSSCKSEGSSSSSARGRASFGLSTMGSGMHSL